MPSNRYGGRYQNGKVYLFLVFLGYAAVTYIYSRQPIQPKRHHTSFLQKALVATVIKAIFVSV